MVVGLVVVAALATALLTLMENSTWDTWAGVFIAPILLLVSLQAFGRQARREGDHRIFWILVFALITKLAFSIFRYYHGFYVVNGADARQYDLFGTDIALRFLDGNFDTGLENLLDTNFIRLFTGIVYTIIHPTVVGGFLIYAWLAFWGTYFFYRAFVLAVPDGNRRSYARWLFFMPSLLFWPSSIGKESWLMFALGIAAFGAAKLLSHRVLPGLVITGIGIGLAALVRAHTGVVLGVGLVLAGLLRRPSRRLGQMKPVARIGSIILFAGIGVGLAVVLQGYLVRAGLGTDFDSVIAESERLTATGGSEFTPVPITSPLGVPFALVTVLFRPFLYEANTMEAFGTAIESSVLLLVVILRFRTVLSALGALRRIPYVVVSIVYIFGSVLALSPVANFGIIARQRTLIYPMLLVLLCIPRRPRAKKSPGLTVAERRGSLPRTEAAAPALSGGRT